MKLKANSTSELTRINNNQILPILRRQKGFRGETMFIAPERLEATANSFWDTKEDAEAYSGAAYPEVLEALAHVLADKPAVTYFEFATSTFHRPAAVGIA